MLASVQLSGAVAGDSVKVYLDEFLMLDSTDLPADTTPQGKSLLTGSAISKQTNYTQTTQEGTPSEREVSPSQEAPPLASSDQQSTIPVKSFTLECKETCNLTALQLNKASYTIRIESKNATLSLDSISYQLLSAQKENISLINTTEENKTLSNLTRENATIINETNTTLEEPITINKPVKWQQRIHLEKQENINVLLPESAQNITLTINESGKEKKGHFKEKIQEAQASRLKQNKKELELMDNASDYTLNYETPAPEVREEISKNRKRVYVSAPDELHYENVITFTNITETVKLGNERFIKLYWIENNSYTDFKALDTNGNGFIDYLEWITPHLSNQTFEIIIITNAQHLDADKNFISNIYEEVKSLDNVWSESIANSEYVRVTFESRLSSKNDITLYPRIVSGNPTIEVYEVNSTQLLAQFNSLNENRYNTIYLTNLQGKQDTFDLRIAGGSVEFDHIIDPSPYITTLVPNNTINPNQNVTSGALTESTFTFSTMAPVDNNCYKNISAMGDNAQCLENEGTTALDAYFLWNVTLPSSNTSINWINLKSISSTATANGSDTLSIAAFNWSGNAWVYLNVTKVAGLGINTTLSYNFTVSNVIGMFVNNTPGNRLRFMSRSNGSANFATDVNIEYLEVQVSYNDTTPPTTNLSAPANNTITALPSIPLNASHADNLALINTTLYVWNSSHSIVNTTMASKTGITNTSNTTLNFPYNGTFYWNYLTTDADSRTAFNNTNWSITYDAVVPSITINWPASIANNTLPLAFNATLNEDGNECNYTLNNGITNLTMQKNGLRDFNASNASIANGTYWVKYYCWDLANNANITNATRFFTFDNALPNVNLLAPANNTLITSASVTNVSFNATFTDNLLLTNSTFYLWNSSNSLINTTVRASTSTSNSTNLTVQIPYQGFFYWNYFAGDNASNYAFNNTNYTINYTLPATNTPPQIISLTAIAAQDPTEDSFTNVFFNFTAYDPDGFADLKDASARANFTRAGEPVRQNLTCNKLNTFASNYANYSCAIQMQYFDAAGIWNISAVINDSLDTVGTNNSNATVTYNTLTAFVAHPAALTWASLNQNTVNQTSNNDPLILNNTGNQAVTVGNVQVNATDLVGETDNTKVIYANNFTVANKTGSNAECDLAPANNASAMSKAVFQAVNHSTLGRGNHSVNDGTTGQEQLYFCIRQIGSEISSQAYSTASQGSWTIKILAAAFMLKRKRKKFKKDRLIQELQVLVQRLQNEHQMNIPDIKAVLTEQHTDTIPAAIFTKKVGCLEALCKYLRENRNMKFHAIAQLVMRDDRTVWTSYHQAQHKQKEGYKEESKIHIPLVIFAQRNLTVFEALVRYLKEQKEMNYAEIGRMLDRDQRNIWTIYSNTVKKSKRNV